MAVNLRKEFINFKDSINRANNELYERIKESKDPDKVFHDFADPNQIPGYLEKVEDMYDWLKKTCDSVILSTKNGEDPPPDPPPDPDPPDGGD